MPFEKGNPGRPIGSKNKNKAAELFASLAFDPLKEAVRIYRLLPDDYKKAKLAVEIAEFVHVKPKSVDVEVTSLEGLVIKMAPEPVEEPKDPPTTGFTPK